MRIHESHKIGKNSWLSFSYTPNEWILSELFTFIFRIIWWIIKLPFVIAFWTVKILIEFSINCFVGHSPDVSLKNRLRSAFFMTLHENQIL